MRSTAKRILPKALIHLFFIIVSSLCIIPMLYVIAISISSENELVQFGYRLFPVKFSSLAYDVIFKSPEQIINSYIVSIAVTAIGTVMNLLITAMVAFSISRRDFKYRKFFSIFLLFPMLFNGGLIPWYILISSYLHLRNTLLVMILPYIANSVYVFLMRSFFLTIPVDLFEAAKIDGASEYKIFWSVLLPLAKPALATVGMFYALIYWNDWWLSMLFIDKNNLVPLQLLLNRIMTSIEYLTKNFHFIKQSPGSIINLPSESARMAVCVLAAGPMLFVFPFFQKYFVRGLIMGSVKG